MLEKDYYKLANDYLTAFVLQNGIKDENPFWIGDEPGGVACVGDYYIDYKDIRTCVDYDVKFDEFDEWYNYVLDLKTLDDSFPTPSLKRWISSDYEPIEKERLIELKEKVNEVKTMLADLIKEENAKNENRLNKLKDNFTK